ncbi:probable disease resistance protein RF45 [Quercus robur]|uniref:probable disease resistance protein RF45 n=1 Tax=Quercus robur TaxID=38942 RepID=UPI00216138DD|nr:probable disease resistance protein RF45 [Quercus robur]
MDGSEESTIVCATAPLLIHKLRNLLNYESEVPIREAIDQLEMISTGLRDAEKIPNDLDINNLSWIEFLKVLQDLEDSTDNFTGEIELQRRNISLKIISPLICLRPQQDRTGLISEKLNLFTTSAKKVFTELENLGPTTGTTSSPLHPIQTRNLDYPVPDDSDFVGLNDKVDEVVKLLCDEETHAIAVTGKTGSGKTFLTKTVYNATEVKRHFDGRAWVNFSEDFESREFLIDILTQLTWDWEFLDENLSYEELKLKLLNFSSNKRCLIVVDDFPTLEYFNRLFDVCGLSSKGIWLMLIGFMQDEELALLEVGACFCHLIRLQSLTDEESWTLFCKKARIAEEEATDLKENILRKCGGSPREILIMEGLLSTTKRPRVIELKIQKGILNLCYHDLSSQMKVCFLYFGLFPRAFEIPVRRLFHLWVAEGLVITLPAEKNMDVAEECLKLLIRRNLIEVTKVRLDGSPKTCRMPTTIWDVFSATAVALGYSHVRNDMNLPMSNIRRVTDYTTGIYPHYYDYMQYLRSYVSFNSRTLESFSKFHDALVNSRGFGLLVVLDLENVHKPAMLSVTLGKLLHLKHLGLRRTFLDSLPRSVGDLPFLETLDVKHTNMTTLPSSIWKAKNLQHLYLNENNFDISFKKAYIRSEIILQTLSGLFVGNKSVVKSYSYTILGLRKLRLTFYSKLAEGIADWISKLKDLQSLKLRSIEEFNRPSTLKLGSLQTHDNLLELYLVGLLTVSNGVTIESLFPPNLKILTLSVSKLEEDPMPILGKLRHLNCLRLFRDSYVGNNMICHAGEFPQLRVLKLWMLENLKTWTMMEGTMPHLRELEIRLCSNLEQAEGLPSMNTLKDVSLINMPDQFVEYVESVLVSAFVKKIKFPFLQPKLTQCPGRCNFNELKIGSA